MSATEAVRQSEITSPDYQFTDEQKEYLDSEKVSEESVREYVKAHTDETYTLEAIVGSIKSQEGKTGVDTAAE